MHNQDPPAAVPAVRPLGRATGTRSAADGELARRFAAGDPSAVRVVYDRFSGPVMTVATSRLHDRALAEEAVQEVFLKAWQAHARYDPQRPLSPWLYAIARRTAADIARRERRRPRTTSLPRGLAAPEAATFTGTWEQWTVRRALQDLPAGERELLRLTHYRGLTQAEIAETLGIPVGTVKSRVHRAHRRLAGRLAHLRDET
ncbi:MAG TPA: sigma-70 family RNA polymerase sigma factor [Acidimicrobiales bacterium]|jgi:RNA polymerase sigma-70 factor (ECF subfamily)